MEAGNLELHLLEQEGHYYADMHLLQEEIFSHTFEIVNGVVKIISKNELRKEESLGRSPDRADSLVIWNWMRHRKKISVRKKFDPEIDYKRYKLKYIEGDRSEAHSWV